MTAFFEANSITSNILKLNSGIAVAKNLFLKFSALSIPEGATAVVENDSTIENIIICITGESVSKIEGTLRIQGAANLFFLNPNGIDFGEYAFLDTGGSFVATTANEIGFADGTQLELSGDLSSSPLTSSVPSRLRFDDSVLGRIRVMGTGHDLKIENLFFPAVTRNSSRGLQVCSGKTFALVGTDLILESGTILGEGATVELSSVREGEVRLDATEQGWTFNYEVVQNFGDIQLQDQALVDASGVSTGSIRVRGRRLSLVEGSLILIQNEGDGLGGSLTIETSESVELSGHSPDVRVQTRLLSQTTAGGKGGSIEISTKRLIVRDGATISALTVSAAQAGNICINASKSLELMGTSLKDFRFFSAINSTSYSSGNTGDLTISTGSVMVLDGGIIACGSLRKGNCGNLTVNAAESVLLVGTNWHFIETSGIHSVTIGEGNCGNVTINACRVEVRDSARIATSTSPSGAKLTINAYESVEVSGWLPGYKESSRIAAASSSFMRRTGEVAPCPTAPSDASAEMTIKTKLLRVTDNGCVTVGREAGAVGRLKIEADSVILSDGSSIATNPAPREGGDTA
ncbi:filamentous hemagglutinin N-terminal domain-containing protein [Brasilonema sp. UFV-L1]|uniref:two-partner secretion domain-containing protein n=1 Tax=Brasilonema sp. UFV-L1 TaxID=2234130 RepID=UPI00145E4614|nr:filamentous hemagglutinin N-terminal domain-containing protein [Brasilonema sp. UFV-L1]NMG08646.1 hypothetical protein [Brasilonema sp. UFV-L1]